MEQLTFNDFELVDSVELNKEATGLHFSNVVVLLIFLSLGAVVIGSTIMSFLKAKRNRDADSKSNSSKDESEEEGTKE
jgi:hypothetical protein